ncbi:MAG TPA: hypothetical protein VGM91_10215 [Conexibacter sp.]|jgi:sugar phosphate isomerase/epimerase
MKLGFLTSCMPERLLEEIAAWAGANGYEALELAAWPTRGDRPFTASHVAVDAFDAREAERVRGTLAEHGLTLSARATAPWEMGWWRYRIPGLGEVDFRRYVDTLYAGGYEGVLSVEHEDPVWGGTPEKVEQGLELAHRTLRPLVVN